MKKQKKGLQKFTSAEKKINELLALPVIPLAKVKKLPPEVYGQFNSIINEKALTLKGVEKDKFFIQIDELMTKEPRNVLWENNNQSIVCGITDFINKYGRMATPGELATKTGLSRTTVHKHLQEYIHHPLYLEQAEQLKFMTQTLLAKIFSFANSGDMQAAKLFLKAMGTFDNPAQTNKIINVVAELGSKQKNTMIQNQNNFIQINNTVLSQDKIKELSPDQLKQIEVIIQGCGVK